jgi:hypothetical protein
MHLIPKALIACIAVLGFSVRSSAGDEQLRPGRSEIAKPPMPWKDSTGLNYTGTVTEVTKATITILWPGQMEPKTFTMSETLASGGFATRGRLRPDGTAPSRFPSYRYRLKDVKVGDHVNIDFAHLAGADICDAICILKRPGGRVPPLPEGAENPNAHMDLPPEIRFRLTIRYHEWQNAYWDLEEKGIPYPEKFGPFRRWPIAPMPREVKR